MKYLQYLCSVNHRYRLEIGATTAEWREPKSEKNMKNQMNNTKEGAQARVNNLSYAMQLAELESQMEQEAIKEHMLLADLECQVEQDAILDQMMLAELANEAEQDAVAEAMYIEDLVYEEELVCF